MKYFATVKHHSTVGYWEEIEANSLTGAKRKATALHGNGYHGHVIHLAECKDDHEVEFVNDLPAHCKVIGSKKGWYKTN